MNREAPEDRLQRERTGVAGDPVPDHEYGDTNKRGDSPHPDVSPNEQHGDVSPSVLRAADDLAAHGIVTERQAVAYVLRDVENVARQDAADRMDTSVSNLDTLLGRARSNIKRARRTVDVADDLDADGTGE